MIRVETVVKLVRKKPDAYIDITVDMDELDLTASEAKATYQKIKDYIFEKHNVNVSSLYITQIKQKYGIIERDCYNKSKDDYLHTSMNVTEDMPTEEDLARIEEFKKKVLLWTMSVLKAMVVVIAGKSYWTASEIFVHLKRCFIDRYWICMQRV